jgi:lysophospholipase L1-like esterase
MKKHRLFIIAVLLISAASFAGCARRPVKIVEQFKQHVAKIQEINKKTCKPGCLAFEGDSNMEWINFQDYFTEPSCNYAYRGSTTADVLQRKEHVFEVKPDSIVLLAGGNDLVKSTPIPEIIKNYGELIRYYKSICKKVYCLSNLPVNPKIFIKNSDIVQINAGLEQTCRKYGATFINVFPYLQKDGGLNPDYAIDPVHLNKAGQDVLVGILKKYLKK